MLYAIDAVFVDKANKVVALVKGIKPWCVSAMYFDAHACLELPVGTIDSTNTEVGDLNREQIGLACSRRAASDCCLHQPQWHDSV